MKLEKGTTISHYKILSEIGAGGMGEVYLAYDLNLDRKVALKLLPSKLTTDEKDLQRFKQEARAASALNHPYILTIFEFGESENGLHFIASEFVEGQTLNKFCAAEDRDLPHKLDILIRIASALAAAHEAGIIHRDVKPENIVVRPDGYVKVLDFGLAKLIEGHAGAGRESEATTLPLVRTNPGRIMGTASYMSPEQAKGKPVDARSDIFSFGVMMYEMVTGHLPFKGGSAMEMIAAILHQEPDTLNEAEITHELKRIIEKALKKDRDERYQTMKDMCLDLKEARRELDFRHKLGNSLQPAPKEAQTQTHHPETTAETIIAQTVQNTLRADAGRRAAYVPVLLGVLGVTAAGVLLWWLMTAGRAGHTGAIVFPSAASYKTVEITNWVNAAGELSSTAAFSGDGRFIAFGSTASGTTGIWVKQTSTGDAIQVTKDEFYNRYPVWSPNGEEIVYYSKRGDTTGLWRVSLMGGRQKLIAGDVDSESRPRLWSKSGKIYFQGSYNLFAADEASGTITRITDFPSTGMPVKVIKISSDETRIAFLKIEDSTWKIVIGTLGDGRETEIFESKTPIDNLVWHPGRESLLFSRKIGEFYQIFTIETAKKSEAVQLSSGESDSFIQDVSADGARILFSTVKENSDLWKIDTDTAKESLVAAQIDAELWADVSPDNKTVVYQSIKNLRQGSNLLNGSLVLQPIAKEAGPLHLAAGGVLPQWSPDGETIAFLKLEGQRLEIWKVSATGDLIKRLSAAGAEGLTYSISPYLTAQVKHISWSPDGSGLAFPATRDGVSNIWLVSADGTAERPLSANRDGDQVLYCPVWAPDGKKIAFSSHNKKRDLEGKTKYTVWVYDTETNTQQKLLETEEMVRLLGWAETDNELLFVVKNDHKIFTMTPPEIPVRAVSLKTGQQRPLTVLKEAYFSNIYLSPDRRSLAFTARATGHDDVWISPLAGAAPRRLTDNRDPRLYYSSLTWTPDGKSVFFGKQTRFTLLSMLINQKIMEETNDKSN